MKRKLYLAFILIFVAANIMHFISNYNVITKPPSEKWSKHVTVAQGKIRSNPKLSAYNQDDLLIAFDDGSKVNILIVDRFGNKKLEKSIDAMDEMVRNLSLLTDGQNFYVSWIISNSGIKSLIKVKFDKDLNVVNTTQYYDIIDSSQISEDVLTLSTSDEIWVEDLANSKTYIIREKAATHLAGAKSKDTIILSYIIGETDFKFAKITNNNVYKNEIGTVGKGVFDTFGDTALSFDKDYGYLLVENKAKGQFGKVTAITFRLDGSEYKVNNLKIGNINYIYNPVSINAGDAAVFLAGSERKVGKKDEQYDIIEFNLKEEMDNVYFVSKTMDASVMPAYNKNYIAFCDYTGNGNYYLNLTSKSEDFKSKFNRPRVSEIAQAIYQTAIVMANSVFYSFIYGLTWLLVGLLLVCLLMFLIFSFSEKQKLFSFIVVYLLTIVSKIYTVYRISYVTFGDLLPDVLSNIYVGAVLSIIISILSLIYGYDDYKNNIFESPFMPFSKALIIDTILTQAIFVPFII